MNEDKNIASPSDNALVIYPNPEKAGRVRLGHGEYMPNVTSRILLSGPPGSGKRNLILNLISRMVPPPSMCHVVHCDPDTIEYDILAQWGIPMQLYTANDFPTVNNIDNPDDDPPAEYADEDALSDPTDAPAETPHGSGKLANPLVVVDEITDDALGRIGRHRFERLVNHVCTHRNATLLCSIQSAASIPAAVRRGFNHYVIWPQPDRALDEIIAKRAGIPNGMLNDLFGLLRDPREFLWIDMDSPPDSEWRYRVGFEPVERYPPDTPAPYVPTFGDVGSAARKGKPRTKKAAK